MKHKTADLEGALLDAAVAKCEGRLPLAGEYDPRGIEAYSSEWADGGPIIERERIATTWAASRGVWFAKIVPKEPIPREWSVPLVDAEGPTPLIAAMRAHVASKLGDEVDLP